MQPDNSIYLFGRIHELANALVVEELQKAGIRDFALSHGDILAVLFREQELTLCSSYSPGSFNHYHADG